MEEKEQRELAATLERMVVEGRKIRNLRALSTEGLKQSVAMLLATTSKRV
jgi:hypothetical protein